MDKNSEKDLQADLSDFRSGEFHIIPANKVYGYMAKVFVFCVIMLTSIHLLNDIISGAFKPLPLGEIKHHIMAVFFGTIALSVALSIVSTNLFMVYAQYKNTIRSEYVLRTFFLKLTGLFFITFAVVDYIGIMPHMSWIYRQSNFDTTTITNALIPFFISFCFYNSEVNRTALGPLLELISRNLPEKY